MLRFILIFLTWDTFWVSATSEPVFNCINLDGTIHQCANNVRPSTFSSNLVAYAKYAQRINETGWNELEIVTNRLMDDSIQAYYAGYLEGKLTKSLIRSSRYNILQENKNNWCKNVSTFVSDNLEYTISMIEKNVNNQYWQQVGLMLYQLAGIDDAIQPHTNGSFVIKPNLNVKPCGVILLNLVTELSDLQNIMHQQQLEERNDRCSALIKLIPNDLLVAHNTWTNYNAMIRLLKKYTFNYQTSVAKSIAMSSYAGVIYSIDDYYLTSTNMVILETSLENYNKKLYDNVSPKKMLFEFIRNMVANRLANNGKEWTQYFSKENGGTYNNQFMIVDYKHLNDDFGLLTVLEQLPHMIVSSDQTAILRNQTYWPSYNIPFYDIIYRESYQDVMYKKYGDFYSYNRTARAMIFARDHSKVTNLTALFYLMRYNDFQHDPLSRCNCSPPNTAEFAIAARCDLNDPNGIYPIESLSFRPHGAIDVKMTSAKLISQLQMVAVSGPTNENVPTFNWNTTKIKQPHLDQPTEWNFSPVKTDWNANQSFPYFKLDY